MPPPLQQEKVQEQERLRLEAERAAQAERKAKEDAVVREGSKLMQVWHGRTKKQRIQKRIYLLNIIFRSDEERKRLRGP